MKTVQVQFEYSPRLSRGILLLKTILGFLICLPHFICLGLLSFVACIVILLSWFAVLFTGKYPKAFFDFMTGVCNWNLRVGSYLGLLCDEYPAFGFKATYPVSFQVTYPVKLSRGILLLRTILGFLYVGIPHLICLLFRFIAYYIVLFIAWWAILFTGKLPRSMFRFLSGTHRWCVNLNAYLLFLTDEYPPFTGKESGPAPVQTGVSV